MRDPYTVYRINAKTSRETGLAVGWHFVPHPVTPAGIFTGPYSSSREAKDHCWLVMTNDMALRALAKEGA